MLFTINSSFGCPLRIYDESKGCHFSANVEIVSVTDGMLRVTVPLFSPPPSFMITVPVLNVQRSTFNVHLPLSLSPTSLFFCRLALRISVQMTDEMQPLTGAQTQTPPHIPTL
jgi:hypothetical protein